MLLEYETNREPADFIFRDVLNFCLSTSICKDLNVSLFDILQYCDLATYTFIKEEAQAVYAKRAEIFKQTQTQIQNKQNTILGSSPNAKR